MLAPRAALLTAALAAAVLATGCGGGEDESKAVEKVAQQVFDQSSKGAECRLATPQLLTSVWGSKAACDKASSTGRPTIVGVSATTVDGERATTRVATRVGPRRVTGRIQLRRLDGDWRLDGFGNDFIRSLLRGSLTAGYVQSLADKGIPGTETLFRDGAVERCVDGKLVALPGARQRAVGYAIVGNRQQSAEVKQVQNLLVDCMAATDNGREALRLAFEAGVRGEATTTAEGDCVVARLRRTADSRLVAAEIVRRQKTGAGIGQKLTDLAAQAIGYCAKQKKKSS